MQKLLRKYAFTIADKLKTTKPGKHLEPIELTTFEPDINLFVVTHLNQYVAKTEKLRGPTSQLLVSYVKPHQGSNVANHAWTVIDFNNSKIIDKANNQSRKTLE